MAVYGENLIQVLQTGGVAVMPTDTIYGIVGKAQNVFTVENIYKLRKRTPTKPCIVLIGSMDELEKFSIILSDQQKTALENYWPSDLSHDSGSEAVSVVLDCAEKDFEYLHRGTNTLAFRVPALQEFRDLFLKTGPIVAPSANVEGFPPSRNISEAKNYFGDQVDLYVDGGKVSGKASKVIRLRKDGSVSILRE